MEHDFSFVASINQEKPRPQLKCYACVRCFCFNLPVFRQKTISCLQGRNEDADVENGHVETAGEGEGEVNWESSMDVYPLPWRKQTASGDLLSGTGSSAGCCDDLEGWDGGCATGGDIFILMADPPHCTAETDTTF